MEQDDAAPEVNAIVVVPTPQIGQELAIVAAAGDQSLVSKDRNGWWIRGRPAGTPLLVTVCMAGTADGRARKLEALTRRTRCTTVVFVGRTSDGLPPETITAAGTGRLQTPQFLCVEPRIVDELWEYMGMREPVPSHVVWCMVNDWIRRGHQDDGHAEMAPLLPVVFLGDAHYRLADPVAQAAMDRVQGIMGRHGAEIPRPPWAGQANSNDDDDEDGNAGAPSPPGRGGLAVVRNRAGDVRGRLARRLERRREEARASQAVRLAGVDDRAKRAMQARQEPADLKPMAVPAEDNTCFICTDAHVTAMLLPCLHYMFCKACIDQWLDKGGGGRRKCPVCNTEDVTVVQPRHQTDYADEYRKRRADPAHRTEVAKKLRRDADALDERRDNGSGGDGLI